MTEGAVELRGLTWLNIPGIIAGIALMVLPSLDVWWRFTVADGAVVIGTSPFQIIITSFGTGITSPLLASLSLGLRIIIMYYGVLLVAGSVLRMRDDRRPMSDFLVRLSARKIPWLVLLFVISVAVTDLIINRVLSRMGMQAQVPYFSGASMIPVGTGWASLNVPVTQGFTGVFFIAVLFSILSLAAYFYQDRVILVKTPQGLRFRRMPEQPAHLPSLEEEAAEITGTDR